MNYIIRKPEEPKYQALAKRVLKHGLNLLRDDARVLIPKPFAYWNHTPYMPISYKGYPPASELRNVSEWVLKVYVGPERELKIIGAQRVSNFSF
ncbi:MAG: hypothetical protein ACE5EK_00040 [Nitrospinales bacterium]